MLYFFEQQQYANPQMDEEMQDESIPETSPFEVFTPVKRYYLIQKIRDLSDRLNQLNIKNNALNVVLTFVDSFSYDSLKIIISQIMIEVKQQVEQIKKEHGGSTE